MIAFLIGGLLVLGLAGAVYWYFNQNNSRNRYRMLEQSDAFRLDEDSDEELFNLDADQLEFADDPAFEEDYNFYSNSLEDPKMDTYESQEIDSAAQQLTAGLNDSLMKGVEAGETDAKPENWELFLKQEMQAMSAGEP